LLLQQGRAITLINNNKVPPNIPTPVRSNHQLPQTQPMKECNDNKGYISFVLIILVNFSLTFATGKVKKTV
jgi:hypothetical protein